MQQMYEIARETRGAEQFLVVRQGAEEDINRYLLKMLEYNTIAGILPLKSRTIDGKTVLNFQVGERYRVMELARQKKIGSREAKLIYVRLVSAFLDMKEYFLNADQCVYDLEYLYVDATMNPFLPYLPFGCMRNPEMDKVWREFFQKILSLLSIGEPDPFYDRLMRYLIQADFNLRDFQRCLEDQEEGGAGTAGRAGIKEEAQKADFPAGAGIEEPKRQDGDTGKRQAEKRPGKGVAEISSKKEETARNGKSAVEKGEGEENKAKAGGIWKKLFQGEKEVVQSGSGGWKVKIPGGGQETESGGFPEKALQKETDTQKHTGLFDFGKKGKKGKGEEKDLEPIQTEGEATGGENREDQPEENGWAETVYVMPDEEEQGTVMLQKQPYLVHKGIYIPMEQFPFSIGKASANYIVANPTVSRCHATILQQEDGYYIRDENSKNKTLLNGRQLEPQVMEALADGDQLMLSNEEFTFYSDTEATIQNEP